MLAKVKVIKNQILDIYKEQTEKKFLKQTDYEIGPKATKLQAKNIKGKNRSHSIKKYFRTNP